MSHIVTCRCCKKKFDTDALTNDEWVMPSKNFYYHTKCYEDFKSRVDRKDDSVYISYIFDYLSHDLKVKYNYHMIEQQLQNFRAKNNYTNKGIFYALKYFYDIKRGDWEKGGGGIGIVPYIYQDSCQYWLDRESREKGAMAMIEQQMKELSEREVVKVDKKKKKKNTKAFSGFGDALEMGDL